MVLGQQDAYAEVVVGGQTCAEVRWQQVVPGCLPAQQWEVGECVSTDGPGIPGHLGRRTEDEEMVHGDLVVDPGPVLLAHCGVEGHGRPDVGVGVRHERASVGRLRVRAVRDLRAHVRARIGDQRAALGGSEVCALRDPAPYLRIRVGGVEGRS
ncbi:hypothetical protein ACIBRY_03525 [Streptomyces anulatus]